MKRDKVTYPIIEPIHPILFWRECRFCGKEFKREHGYKIIDMKACRASGEYPFYDSYCCSECGKSEEDVKEKVNEEKVDFIFNRPKRNE